MKYSLGISNFLNDLSSFPFYCFPLFLCIDHLGRLSYLSLLFLWTLHSDGYIFPFLLCLLLLFFSQLFISFLKQPFCLAALLFLGMILVTASFTMLKVKVKSVSPVWLFATLWTVAPKLFCPWDSLGKNIGVGCHAILRGTSWPRVWTHISYVSCIDRQVLYH